MAESERVIASLVGDGFYVFPLSPNSKIPYKGFDWTTLSSNDPKQIKKWLDQYPNCNWGVDTGRSKLFVVDIDVKKDKTGYATIESLLAVEERRTMVVRTASGGCHLYYDGEGPTTVQRIGNGVDTRGLGGYVVAPSSVIDGVTYEIKLDTALLPIPDAIKLSCAPTKKTLDTQQDVKVDKPHILAAAIDYLTKAEPAVEGVGGDVATFKVAAKVRDLGVSEAQCLSLIALYFNPRCEPPWDDHELELKVRNAYAYASNDIGVDDAENVFKQKDSNKSFSVTRADQLDFFTIPKRRWLMNGRYVRGVVTVTVAEGGAGKSTLVLLEMIAIATGKELTGFRVPQKTNVLYFNTEDDMNELARKIAACSVLHGIDKSKMSGLFLKTGRDFSSDEERFLIVKKSGKHGTPFVQEDNVATLINFIKENGIGVVCLDPMVDLHDCDENSNVEMNLVTKTLARIAGETDCSISIVHHVNKPAGGAKGWENSASQSSRGASSVVDCARVCHALLTMPKEMAKTFGIPADDHWQYVTLNSGKLNLCAKNTSLVWMKKLGVKIQNGEEVGCMETAELQEAVSDPVVEIIKAMRTETEIGETIKLARLADRLVDSDEVNFSKEAKVLERKLEELLEGGFDDNNGKRSYTLYQGKDKTTNRACKMVKVEALNGT